MNLGVGQTAAVVSAGFETYPGGDPDRSGAFALAVYQYHSRTLPNAKYETIPPWHPTRSSGSHRDGAIPDSHAGSRRGGGRGDRGAQLGDRLLSYSWHLALTLAGHVMLLEIVRAGVWFGVQYHRTCF